MSSDVICLATAVFVTAWYWNQSLGLNIIEQNMDRIKEIHNII